MRKREESGKAFDSSGGSKQLELSFMRANQGSAEVVHLSSRRADPRTEALTRILDFAASLPERNAIEA